MFMLDEVISENKSSQQSSLKRVNEYNELNSLIVLQILLIAIPLTVISVCVSLLAGDAFLLLASSRETGSELE
jgi:hypothetical protein